MLNINYTELDGVLNRLACKIDFNSGGSLYETYAKLLELKIKALTSRESY